MIIVPDTRHQIQRINLETMSLGLLGAYISSSSDSESDSQDEIQDKEVSPKKPAVPLQNPFNNPEVAKVQLPKPSFMQEQVEKIEGKSKLERKDNTVSGAAGGPRPHTGPADTERHKTKRIPNRKKNTKNTESALPCKQTPR